MSPRLRSHRAPFPYFGGKAAVAAEVWARLGDVGRYVEPFAGSLAVLLVRPAPFTGREIVNDLDGLLVNVWRAMAHDPEAVAAWADWPATENDLHARHAWLVGQREDITRRLEGDPDWFDAKAAGWWLWGIGLWIGGGWCSGKGPWRVVESESNDGRGIHRKLLHAGDDGQGIHRQRLPLTGNSPLHGVHSDRHRAHLADTFAEIAERMRDVLIMCGDWTRVVTPAVLQSGGSSKPGWHLPRSALCRHGRPDGGDLCEGQRSGGPRGAGLGHRQRREPALPHRPVWLRRRAGDARVVDATGLEGRRRLRGAGERRTDRELPARTDLVLAALPACRPVGGGIIDAVPRRADHEGTRPRKLANRELYRVRVMLDGKVHDRYGATPKEAADKARALVRDWDRGFKPLDGRYTVGQWLADWLRDYTATLAPRTVQSYGDTVRLYIAPRYPEGHAEAGEYLPLPAIGRLPLAKLSEAHVAAMLRDAKGPRGELSGTTRRYVYSVLRISLGRALKLGRVHRNVATLVDPPSRSAFRVTPLTPDEAERLLTALGGKRHKRHEALIVTDLATGLREGELLGLVWPAVDLDAGTIEVRGQLARGTKLLVAPKRESRRIVNLPPTAVAALRAHRLRQTKERIGQQDWDPRDFVFTTPTGQPLTNGTPVRAFQAAAATAGLPRQRFHDLRHAFATWLIEAGADLAVVSKLLGHRTLATTADVYGHLTPTMREDAAERIEKRLRRAR